jgi:hypothetical protein
MNQKKYQVLSNACQTTFGKSSATTVQTAKVTAKVLSDEELLFQVQMIVNLNGPHYHDNKVLIDQFCEEARGYIRAYVQKVEESYKENAKTLLEVSPKTVSVKLKRKLESHTIEYLTVSYNANKSAFFKFQCPASV